MLPPIHTIIFPTGGASPQSTLIWGLRGTGWVQGSDADEGPARQGSLSTATEGEDWGLAAFRADAWPGTALPWLLDTLSAELEGRVGYYRYTDESLEYDEWDSGVHHVGWSREIPTPADWTTIEERWGFSVPVVDVESEGSVFAESITLRREPIPWSDEPSATERGDDLFARICAGVDAEGEYVLRGFGLLRRRGGDRFRFTPAMELRKMTSPDTVPRVASEPIVHHALLRLLETGQDIAIGRNMVLWRQRIGSPVPRPARNPQTGAPIHVEPRTVVGLDVAAFVP